MSKSDNKQEYQTKLRKAKGLGAAGHGVEHWWVQRVTAVALIPLTIWFVVSLIGAVMFPTPEMVAAWLVSPFNAIALALFVVALFAHAVLGLQVVIEDYIHCEYAKYFMLVSIKFIAYIFAGACLLSIMRLHFIDTGYAF